MEEPRWALGLALVILVVASGPRVRPARAPTRVEAPSAIDLATASARALRRVPGLGERRALALVDARWRHAPGGPPLLLGDVQGVGPASAAAVAAWLAEHAVPGAR